MMSEIGLKRFDTWIGRAAKRKSTDPKPITSIAAGLVAFDRLCATVYTILPEKLRASYRISYLKRETLWIEMLDAPAAQQVRYHSGLLLTKLQGVAQVLQVKVNPCCRYRWQPAHSAVKSGVELRRDPPK